MNVCYLYESVLFVNETIGFSENVFLFKEPKSLQLLAK